MVIDGAFFPQSDFQVPQKKVGQDACQDMLMPSTKFPDLIMVHPQFDLCFFEALLNSPAQPAEPNEAAELGAPGSIADKVRILQLVIDMAAPDYEPDFLARKTFLVEGDASFGKLIAGRSLGALGNRALVPVKATEGLGKI